MRAPRPPPPFQNSFQRAAIQPAAAGQLRQREPFTGHQATQIGGVIRGGAVQNRNHVPTLVSQVFRNMNKRIHIVFRGSSGKMGHHLLISISRWINKSENTMIDAQRLLARFLRYVQVDTTAREDAGQYPSSPGQIELGKMLVDDLRSVGLSDAAQSKFGIITASVPATVQNGAPTVALNAHVDTSPETTGAGVKPQVVRSYDGRDLVLPGDKSKVIRVADNPELRELVGRTIITTDGTTLLGADDKAGVAVIVELAAHLLEQRNLPHGPVKVLFTCDEEIGHGVDHVDLAQLGATVCYTLDGRGADEIDVETFSADLAIVAVRGVNIHPSIGKGKMVNAIRVASEFIARLPRTELSPESTDGREGFLHPYVVTGGGVAEVTLRILLRDFDTHNLGDWRNDCVKPPHKRWPSFPVRKSMCKLRRNIATWPTDCERNPARWRLPSRPSGEPAARRRKPSFAAAPMARGSPSWACRRRTCRRASTIRTRRWNGPVWRKWNKPSKCWQSWFRFGEQRANSRRTA